jgi:two-component system nitrate/nitrite response regulator NarL
MTCRLLADALQRARHYHAAAVVTPKDALEALNAAPFHVALVSSAFPEDPLGGFQLMRQIQTSHPNVALVAMLDAMDRDVVIEAFRSGARGVFCRVDSFPVLCKCIHCVHQGQVWASSEELHYVLDALAQPAPLESVSLSGSRPLSKREEEIARLVAEGLSNREISQRLDLSEHTIKNYLFRVFEKLGVSTRVELALYALKRGHVRRLMPQVIRPAASKFGPERLSQE